MHDRTQDEIKNILGNCKETDTYFHATSVIYFLVPNGDKMNTMQSLFVFCPTEPTGICMGKR